MPAKESPVSSSCASCGADEGAMHERRCSTLTPSSLSSPELSGRLRHRLEDNLMFGYEPDPKVEIAKHRKSVDIQLKQCRANIDLLARFLKDQKARRARLLQLKSRWAYVVRRWRR